MIHDLGKCCAGFQAAVRGQGRFRQRHEVLSIALLPWILGDDEHQDSVWIAASVLTHHRDLDEISTLYPHDFDFDSISEQLQPEATPEFFEVARSIFIESFEPPLRRAFGLVPAARVPTIPADGVSEIIRPLVNSALDLALRLRRNIVPSECIASTFLRGVLLLADHAGSAHTTFGTTSHLKAEASMRDRLGINQESLYSHQRELPAGNATLIAPTGSGKTEASLLWASRTGSRAAGNPVLFYVLPYQASINAMRDRLALYFGDAKVTLQHSRAVQIIYRQLLERDYQPALAEGLAKKERSLAKLYAKPVRVLTPYQLLRGAFQLKGHEALWTDAAGSLMIFDEIHAYEPSRLGMILATLRYLNADLGVRALFVSATLPTRLLRCIQAVLMTSSHVVAQPSVFEEFRRHRIHLLDGDLLDSATIQRVLSRAAAGEAVLIVATTVGRAQQFFRQLQPHLGEQVSLLHGRFHSEDRFRKEKKLLAKRGPHGADPIVLVATQVVEVSLDIDFDVLFSDPAPLEALVQRFGRVNRKRRVPLRDVFVMKSIPEGCPVYKEHLILAAIEQLQRHDGKPFDESQIQIMLDAIYDGDFGDDWIESINRHISDFQRNVLDTMRPFQSSEDLEKAFDDLFDGFQVLPKCLEAEYQRRLQEDELSAPELLVPITRGQYFAIKPTRAHSVLIADRPYSEEDGLDINAAPQVDGI
jgi:CRISPR-associated endonuclease/helicase Cas3